MSKNSNLQVTLHGSLVEVYEVGVLLKGPSAIGKSESAVEMVMAGHKFIADDVVLVKKRNNQLIGSQLSTESKNYPVEIKGLGIIDVAELFGTRAVKKSGVIEIEVELYAPVDNKIVSGEYLGDLTESKKYLGIEVNYYRIPVTPGRNISKLVEIIVLNYKVMKKSGKSFIDNLNQDIIDRNLRGE